MKKSVAILLVFALLMLCGCEGKSTVSSIENPKEESMFVLVENAGIFAVVYHRDTNVMYAISRDAYNSGNFCLLVNPDGTPMLWEGGGEE